MTSDITTASPGKPVERLALNKQEAAAALGISDTTLWRLEKRGKIRSVPGIRHKIYPRAELERFLSALGSAS